MSFIFLAIEYYLVKKQIQILGLKFYFISTDLFVSIKEINIPHKWPRPLIPLNNGAGNKLKVEGRLKIKKWHRVKVI